MADVKKEFVDTCGDLVTFMTYEIKGRALRVLWRADGDKNDRALEVKMMNSSDREIVSAARTAGRLAGQHAYVVTGKRDRDFEASKRGQLT